MSKHSDKKLEKKIISFDQITQGNRFYNKKETSR